MKLVKHGYGETILFDGFCVVCLKAPKMTQYYLNIHEADGIFSWE